MRLREVGQVGVVLIVQGDAMNVAILYMIHSPHWFPFEKNISPAGGKWDGNTRAQVLR